MQLTSSAALRWCWFRSPATGVCCSQPLLQMLCSCHSGPARAVQSYHTVVHRGSSISAKQPKSTRGVNSTALLQPPGAGRHPVTLPCPPPLPCYELPPISAAAVRSYLRNLLMPAFTPEAISRSLPQLELVVSQWLERWEAAGEPVRAWDSFKALTFDFIMRVSPGTGAGKSMHCVMCPSCGRVPAPAGLLRTPPSYAIEPCLGVCVWCNPPAGGVWAPIPHGGGGAPERPV